VRVSSAWPALVLVASVLATGPAWAAPQPADPLAPAQAITLVAYNVGDRYWFERQGDTTENPTLHLAPGTRVEVTVVNRAHLAHDLRFGSPIDRVSPLLEPGQQETFSFNVPPDAHGTSRYWCEPHNLLGMSGKVVFGSAHAAPTPPWAAWVAVGASLAAAAWRRPGA